jgi:MFS family permease
MATVNILNQGFYATMDSQHDVLDNYPKNHKTKHQAEECHELSEQGPLTQKQEIETKHSNTTTTILLNIASGLDGCDDQLLPASFRVMEAELGFHPSLLGHITFGQILASSLSCPFWGYFADRYSRKLLIIIGLLSWGTATIGLGFASTLSNVVVLRLINGIFLGSIGPVCQSILADMCHSTTRGYYFGMIQMCSSGGRVIGGVLMTSIAFMYFYRYRVSFLLNSFPLN